MFRVSYLEGRFYRMRVAVDVFVAYSLICKKCGQLRDLSVGNSVSIGFAWKDPASCGIVSGKEDEISHAKLYYRAGILVPEINGKW